MKIDWKKYHEKDHVIALLLTEVMGKKGLDSFGKLDSSSLEVELKINGVKVPLIETMEFLQSQLDNVEENGRKAGYKQAINDMQDKFNDLLGR